MSAAVEEESEAPGEARKGRAWRGMRGFLKEYLIIVVGVLTALGAQQGADTLHERKIAGEAREAIRAEVRENLWWLDRRAASEPCVQDAMARLSEIAARARRGEAAPVLAPMGWLPMFAKITSQRWDANAQAGRASLFSGDEQRVLGNLYYTTEMFRRAQDAEQAAWAKMGFAEGLEHLSASEAHDLSLLLAEARRQDWMAQAAVLRAHQWADKLGLKAENANSVEGLSGTPACARAG